MKRVLLGIVMVALAVLLVPSGALAAKARRLTPHAARSAAEDTAYEFQAHHRLDSDAVGRCKRRTRTRIDCEATATGETAHRAKRCDLQVMVRTVRETYFWGLTEGWDAQASITRHRCQVEALPYLTSSRARPAIQMKADTFAGVATKITDLRRDDDVTYRATAKWERAALHPTEVFPTESCSVELRATLSADRVLSVSTEGYGCY